MPRNARDSFRGLTHLSATGEARMVDVSAKPETVREAVARARLRMAPSTVRLVRRGDAPKGDVLGVARTAGILAAKRTHELVPLCHPLRITGIDLGFALDERRGRVEIEARVRTVDKTGVEMEALTAASVAALAVYDMVKGVERGVRIERVELVEKAGGRSGHWVRPGARPTVGAGAPAPGADAQPAGDRARPAAGGAGASRRRRAARGRRPAARPRPARARRRGR